MYLCFNTFGSLYVGEKIIGTQCNQTDLSASFPHSKFAHFCPTFERITIKLCPTSPLALFTQSLSLSLSLSLSTYRAAPTDGESLTGPPDDCVWLACPDPQLCASEKCSHLWLSARSPLHCLTLNSSAVREAFTMKTHLDMNKFRMVLSGWK